MKIYGRTRYQTQAFVDQNCWIHSFQDPATLDGVLLAAQTNIDGPDYPNFYTSFCTSDFGPLPHSHTPGQRAGPGQSPWGGRAPGPPTMSGHCIYPLDPSSSSACQRTELGPTDKKRMLLWKNAQVIIFHLQKTFVFIIILYSVPVINSWFS